MQILVIKIKGVVSFIIKNIYTRFCVSLVHINAKTPNRITCWGDFQHPNINNRYNNSFENSS